MARVTHIAVVDDESEIRESIDEYLTMHGFKVSQADGGTALRRLFAKHGSEIDLVILDIRMPGEDGLSLARWLREHAKVGVIMLTASGETVDRIPASRSGRTTISRSRSTSANSLPGCGACSARVAAMPTKPTMPEQVRFGKFILDLGAKRLSTEGGDDIQLTSMEFDLLKVFATHPNRVLSRDQLLDLAHGRGSEPFDRSIDIRVTRLRRKIESDPDHPEVIKTVRGAGYMFVPDETGKV